MIYEKEKHQTVNKIKRALKATYLCWKYPFLTHKVDEGKFIKTIRDPYGAPCYMVVDGYTNCVVAGEHGIYLAELAKMYNVAI